MSPEQRTPKLWRKRLLIALVALLVLVLAVVTALLAALRSEAGTAWVLEQLPGLETRDAQGSLLGRWQAEALAWQGYGIRLQLDAPSIDWSPTCLLRKTLCLDSLKAAAMELSVQPSQSDDAPPDGPVPLPEVTIPVNLVIESVDLGRFRLNDTLIWDQLQFRGSGGGADFHLDQLKLSRQQVNLEVSGRLATRGDWPLSLAVDLTLPPPYGDQWRVTGQLAGSARELRADLTSEGYLDGELDAMLSPLEPDLPVRAELAAGRFLALDTLPQTLTLKDWTLTARGNRADGYRLNSRAQLPGTQGPVDLDLSTRITPSQAQEISLSLSGPSVAGDQSAGLALTGQVSWRDGLVASGELNMGAFAWYGLLPEMAPPPVAIQSLQAKGSFDTDQYQANITVAASGPMGETTLETAVAGDFQQVQLSDLMVTTGGGRLQGQAEVAFDGPVRWQAGLNLDDFDPGYWVPEAAASLDGEITSSGQLSSGGQPDFDVDWDIDGRWRSADLLSRGEITARSDIWQIPEVMAHIGNNRLDLSGRLTKPLTEQGEVDLSASVSLPEPEVLQPGLTGQLEASLSASGPFSDPQGLLTVTGDALGWQEQLTAGALQLQASLAQGRVVDASVQVDSIRSGGQQVEQVTADLTGTVESHRLTLYARHPQAVVDAVLAGGWNSAAGGQWHGELASGQVELPQPDQIWRLQAPAAIRYDANTLTVGEHCWRWQQSAVCAGNQTLLPEPALDYQLRQLPTSALSSVMPEDLKWEAVLNGRARVTLGEAGPVGQLSLTAGPGSLALAMDESWQSFTYSTLDLKADLAPEQADLDLSFRGDELGSLTAQLSVNPVPESMPVTGSYRLDGMDLAWLGNLLKLEEVAGVVNGSGRLEGPLMNPEVFGELVLADGRVIDPMVPVPVDSLRVSLTFDGRRADLDGSWQSAGLGQGQVGGKLDWQDQPELSMTLSGETLPVHIEPYAEVAVSPDLEMLFRNGDLSVTGEIDVPKGRIHIRELPEQAVSVSSDEVILGGEAQEPAVRSLDMDIRVSVGRERVSFEGFGVTGNLDGVLRLGNELDTRGTLQLKDGRYEAFGQELELRRARLVFVGAVDEPYLDVEAVRRVDQVVAGIRLTGPAREPRTTVFSEPSMSQNEALSYLVLGRPLRSQGDQGQVSRAALSLGLNQASGITRNIGEAVGIRDLTLEAEGSGDDAAVVASGYLTEDLSIRYGVGLFEPITTVALRYDLGRYFYVEAASGIASSLDLFYTRDF